MKRTLTAIAATAAVFAGTASAQVLTADTETLTFNLNGFVQSDCTMTPNGTLAKNIVMTQEVAQNVSAITFSCNSPYEVSVESEFGGMDHQQSDLVIPYQLRTRGSVGTGPDTNAFFQSTELTTAGGQIIESSDDWLSIAANQGTRQINLDVGFTPETYAVAGNYADTLTVTLTAVF